MSFKKLKIFIASTIFLIGLLLVSIFLISYSNLAAFPYLFFLFSLFWITPFIPRKLSELNNAEKGVIIISFLLIVISLTLFANSVKIYSDKEQQLTDLQLQIDEISKTNEYYSTYSASLKDTIYISIANSDLLQAKINNLNKNAVVNGLQKESIIRPIINLTKRDRGDEEKDD